MTVNITTLFPSIFDSYIDSSFPGTNYGSIGNEINYVGYSGSSINRALVKFDLSGISYMKNCAQATLRLYLSSDLSLNDTTWNVYRVKRNWSELNVTWSQYSSGNSWQTAGGLGVDDVDTTPLGSSSTISSISSIGTEIDISLNVSELQKMYNGNYINYGFLIKASNESQANLWGIGSRRNADSSYWPSLSLTLYNPNLPVSATGGIITTSGSYKIHTFTSSGTFNVSTAGEIEYLVVGGGGGGGGNVGGGGGAGGFLSGSSVFSAVGYTVTVGNGGAGGTGATSGTSGNFSEIYKTSQGTGTLIKALGGGGGGNGGTASYGQDGGSGGGGGGYVGRPGGNGTAGQGTNGGAGDTTGNPGARGGGGGGGSQAGASGPSSGNGGLGSISYISGLSVYYAGGGGGGAFNNTGGTGGTGGGGNGGNNIPGSVATVNTGGGGGGGGAGNANGAAGGSGIVIIRYPLECPYFNYDSYTKALLHFDSDNNSYIFRDEIR